VALRALARREHSQQELRRKLHRYAEDDLVLQVLKSLCEQNLQSDERFAAVYINYRSGRGYGPLRIEAELRERGVAAEIISTSLAAAMIDWFVLADKVRRKRFGADLPNDYSQRARQMRFLQYRGFDGEQIKVVLTSMG
jgi:regulatory protein